MTGVRQSVTRNAYVYETRAGKSTHRTLGNETRLGKPHSRTQEGAATPFSSVRALRVVFSADAQEDCPFRSGDSVHRAGGAGRRVISSGQTMTGDTRNHLHLDLDADHRRVGPLSTPFLVGCASSVPLFYTPHEQGSCWLRLRGRTTYHSDYLSWHIPRVRVHRSTFQPRSPGVPS